MSGLVTASGRETGHHTEAGQPDALGMPCAHGQQGIFSTAVEVKGQAQAADCMAVFGADSGEGRAPWLSELFASPCQY